MNNEENILKILEVMRADIDRIHRSVVLIEIEHGNKLSALLDGYKQNTETLAEHSKILADHTNRLERIEDKITTHDIQIHVLDKTKPDKRKAK
jgi:hypothetical protein